MREPSSDHAERWWGELCDSMWIKRKGLKTDIQRAIKDWTTGSRIFDVELCFDFFGKYLLSLAKGSRILDSGCGWGRYSIPIAARGYNVTALDKNRKLLDLLNEYAVKLGVTNISVVHGRMENADRILPKDSYDAVLLLSSLNYLRQTDKMLNVLKKHVSLTREGGLVIVSSADKLNAIGWLFHRWIFVQNITEIVRKDLYPDWEGQYYKPLTPSEFRKLIEKAGLEVIKFGSVLFFPWLDTSPARDTIWNTLFYSHPDLPKKLKELNEYLSGIEDYKNIGYFTIGVCRRKD